MYTKPVIYVAMTAAAAKTEARNTDYRKDEDDGRREKKNQKNTFLVHKHRSGTNSIERIWP